MGGAASILGSVAGLAIAAGFLVLLTRVGSSGGVSVSIGMPTFVTTVATVAP